MCLFTLWCLITFLFQNKTNRWALGEWLRLAKDSELIMFLVGFIYIFQLHPSFILQNYQKKNIIALLELLSTLNLTNYSFFFVIMYIRSTSYYRLSLKTILSHILFVIISYNHTNNLLITRLSRLCWVIVLTFAFSNLFQKKLWGCGAEGSWQRVHLMFERCK